MVRSGHPEQDGHGYGRRKGRTVSDIRTVLGRIMDDLVEVPGGTTVIGSTRAEIEAELAAPDLRGVDPSWLLKELPKHTVQVPGFRISRVPLTAGQLAAIAGETGVAPIGDAGPDEPGTVEFALVAALYEALSHFSGHTMRPPTEQEWVRAARGGDERVYPWGDTWEDGRGNLGSSSAGRLLPVGSFPAGASAFGLLDMAGNADELTGTRYAPFDGAPPEVPSVESWAYTPFITKGGGYMHNRDLARCDRRHGIYEKNEPLALRVVVP
jgi:toxoflavin biosynthesis protein ToxD